MNRFKDTPSSGAQTGGMRPEGAPLLNIDLAALPPAQRVSSLLAALDGLNPGEVFTFSASADPAPLYYRCDRDRPGQASWDYLRCGPDRWVVQVARR